MSAVNSETLRYGLFYLLSFSKLLAIKQEE
jgi:hypothetical protein